MSMALSRAVRHRAPARACGSHWRRCCMMKPGRW
jgi:hypothetical protein